MSASFGDYDNDGRLDLYVANIRSEHGWFATPPTVWRYMLRTRGARACGRPTCRSTSRCLRQSGRALRRDVPADGIGQHPAPQPRRRHLRGRHVPAPAPTRSAGSGARPSATSTTTAGRTSTAPTAGCTTTRTPSSSSTSSAASSAARAATRPGRCSTRVRFGRRSWHGWERNRLLRNDGPDAAGRVTFREIGRRGRQPTCCATAAASPSPTSGTAASSTSPSPPPATATPCCATRARGGQRHWLEVELVGTDSNRDGVGARVTAASAAAADPRGGARRRLRLAEHAAAALRPRRRAPVDELTVRWPRSGVVRELPRRGRRPHRRGDREDPPTGRGAPRGAVMSAGAPPPPLAGRLLAAALALALGPPAPPLAGRAQHRPSAASATPDATMAGAPSAAVTAARDFDDVTAAGGVGAPHHTRVFHNAYAEIMAGYTASAPRWRWPTSTATAGRISSSPTPPRTERTTSTAT